MWLRRNARGVTLVEIMAAMFNFMIGLTALFAVYAQTANAGKSAEHAYVAYNLAKNHVDTLKARSFHDLPSSSEISTVLNADGYPNLTGEYIRSTTVATSYSGDPNLTQVTVSVYYVIKGVQSPSPMQISTVIFNGT